MSDVLGLYCWVLGDDPKHCFPVEIPKAKDVGALKDAIKAKKPNRFQSVDADTLTLWKVSIPFEERHTRLPAFQPREDSGIVELSLEGLTRVFPGGPPPQHIHIIVQCPDIIVQRPEENPLSEKEAQKGIDDFLGGCEGKMNEFISGKRRLPTFDSTDIPVVHGVPSLTLHKLGEFSHMEQRIGNVFCQQAVLFVNTSGSGKTRILLDGLCKHWGFYVTCGHKSLDLGSSDLRDALAKTGTDPRFKQTINPITEGMSEYSTELAKSGDELNRSIARHNFFAAFLSRATLLKRFRELATTASISDDHQKRLWVLLQIWPRLLDSDVFRDLASVLYQAPPQFIADKLAKVMSQFNHIPYVVLDEAQEAANLYPKAFLSKTGKIHRAILSEVVKSLDDSISAYKIVTGTGIQLDLIREQVSSGSAKLGGEVEVVHGTGSFDNEEDQSAYIMGYLWPGKNRDDLPDDAKCLLRRAARWLRGRYRVTSSFIEQALLHSPMDPNEVLNHFFDHMCGFWPNDNDFTVAKQKHIRSPHLPIITHTMVETLTQDKVLFGVLLHCFMKFALSGQITYQSDKAKALVEIGVARFGERVGEAAIADIKEPIAIYALMQYFRDNGQTVGQYLNDLYFTARGHSPGNVFEEIIAWNLCVAFSSESGQKLNSIFHFCGTPPEWADEHAHLMAITREAGTIHSTKLTQITIPFIHKAPDAAASLAWVSNPRNIPILLPDDHCGPDIVLVLETAKTKRRVIGCVQTKSTLDGRIDYKAALATINPDQLYMVKRTSADENRPWKPDLGVQFREHLKHIGSEMTPTNTLRVLATLPTKFQDARRLDVEKEAYPILSLLHEKFFQNSEFNYLFEHLMANHVPSPVRLSKKRRATTNKMAVDAKRQKIEAEGSR